MHGVELRNLEDLTLAAGEKLPVAKRQRIQDFTTRKHHPGTHRVQLLINGEVFAEGAFVLRGSAR